MSFARVLKFIADMQYVTGRDLMKTIDEPFEIKMVESKGEVLAA